MDGVTLDVFLATLPHLIVQKSFVTIIYHRGNFVITLTVWIFSLVMCARSKRGVDGVPTQFSNNKHVLQDLMLIGMVIVKLTFGMLMIVLVSSHYNIAG